MEPITFHGEDLETQSKLLLNKALFPISLTPSDSPDAITNISISAEGNVTQHQRFNMLSVIQHQGFNMLSVTQHQSFYTLSVNTTSEI